VPLVLLLRKSRLFAEWLLPVWQGDDAPRPLMLEPSYIELAGALLGHLNEYHDLIQTLIGDEEFIPVLQEFLFVANLEARGVGVSKEVKALTERIFNTHHDKLTLLAVTASCRSIIQLEKLAQFLESVLQVWKDNHSTSPTNGSQALDTSAPDHWQTVSATLQVPEISFDDWIFSCLNNGSILTLHVVSLQQLMMSAKMLSNPYSSSSAVSSGGGQNSVSQPPSQPHMLHVSQSSFLDAVPATPSTSSLQLLDPLKKHTMAQPRSSLAHSTSSQPLDPKPIQQRIDQLFQWLSKTQVKSVEPKKGDGGKREKAAAAPSQSNVLDEEDVEPVKLHVIIRTLFEWQGALAKAYLQARNLATYPTIHHMRWSNPLLAQLMLYPLDPFPLLTYADKLVDQFQLLLLRWLSEIKNSSSVLSMIGLSNTPRYSAKFRLLLKAIHTYLMLHVQSTSATTAVALASGQLKVHKAPPMHYNWDANPATITPAASRTALINTFTQLATNKPFVPFANTIRIVAAILTQSTEPERHQPANPPASTFVPLIYAPAVLDQLIGCIFPELGI
jgi:hypothetical protein